MNQKPLKQTTSEISHWSGIFITRTIGAWAIASALLIALGGAERWTSHAYDELNLMPGSPFTWAAIIGAAGLCIIIGSITQLHVMRFSLRNLGLWVTALWCFILVIGFVAATLVPGVSYNISTTYFLVGVLSIFATKTRFTP
jgi:hypothetical protein